MRSFLPATGIICRVGKRSGGRLPRRALKEILKRRDAGAVAIDLVLVVRDAAAKRDARLRIARQPMIRSREVEKYCRVVQTEISAAAHLAHDPEKWEPVFGKDHAQTKC